MKYRVKAAAKPFGGQTVEIAIYDVVGDLGEAGGVTAKDVLGALGEASQAQEVNVRINSAGGSVTEGFAIYNALRERSDAGSKVKVRIDGLAASIASVIAMAGDEVEIAENAFVMIHNPFALIEGESDELRKMAEHLDDVSESMLGIYADRTGLSTEKLSAMCDAETWLSASEALELGFVDKVAKRSRAQALALYDFSRFRAVPEVLAKFTASPPASNKDPQMAAKDEDDTKDKKIAELKEKLEAAEKERDELKDKLKAKAEKKDDSDDDGDEDEDSEAKARVIAAAVAVTGIEDLPRLEGALMALTHKRSNEHAARVLAAIKDGKLAPARKDWALNASAETFAAYLDGIGDQRVTPVGREYTPDPTQAQATKSPAQLSADAEKIARLSGIDPAKLAASLPQN
jgi:ATP-dependent Clp endopeptidase proteolytic subunit ClpP